MEKKLTTDQVKNLLDHVIRTIDRWWNEITNLKSGYFTRSYIGNSSVTYKDYVEWRYIALEEKVDYASIFISLDCEDGTDYIGIVLKKLKNGVYTEYDPFCEIYDGKTEVVISEQTGFAQDNTIHDVLTEKDFNVLTDNIATTVHRFVTPPDEEKVSVNMDAEEAKKQQQEKIAELLEKTCAELDYRKNVMTFWTQRHEFASVVESIISETLDQFCSPECDRQHELFHQYVRYLMRNKTIDPNVIDHSRYNYRITTGDNNTSLKFDIVADGEFTRWYSFWYSFDTSPVMIASIVVESHDCKSPLGYCDTTDIILESHVDGNKELKEVTTICQLQRGDDGAIQLIRCFDPVTTCGPCICEKLFLAFHAVIGHSVASSALLQETCEESKEEMMDTETNVPAIKAGLMTKEVFVLDTSYFVIGDIYLLEIDPVYDWSKISTTPVKVPRWVYAICEDVCSTVIDFMLGGIDGRDGLLRMQVHADEIESGLVTVKRVLMNETLIQTEDEECL